MKFQTTGRVLIINHLLAILFSVICFEWCSGQSAADLDLTTIQAATIEAPPDWALMQRRLIDAMQDAGDFYWQRFMNEGGTTISQGPYDDLYEMFYNWPYFYMIGANKRFFDRGLTAYNGITRL